MIKHDFNFKKKDKILLLPFMIHVLIPDVFKAVNNVYLVLQPISVKFNEQMHQRNARKLNLRQIWIYLVFSVQGHHLVVGTV